MLMYLFQFRMRQQERLRALGVEKDLYLIVLRHLVTIDAHDRTLPEHTMRNPIACLP